MNKKFLFYRAYIIYFSFVLFMCIVVYMTLSIQLSDRKSIFNSDDSRIPKRIVVESAQYGDILDKDLNPLVTTVSYYDIYMDPIAVEQSLFDSKISMLSKELSDLFKDKSPKEYENRIREKRAKGNSYVLIQKQVTNEQRKKLRQFHIFEEGQMKGGLITKEITVRKKLRGR